MYFSMDYQDRCTAQRIVETYVWHARTFPTPKPDMATLMVAALNDVAEGISTKGIEEARKSDRFGSLIEILKMAQLAPSMDNIVQPIKIRIRDMDRTTY